MFVCSGADLESVVWLIGIAATCSGICLVFVIGLLGTVVVLGTVLESASRLVGTVVW
ncbi:MAG: hypothetical protein AB2401_09395 [Bacillus sp. (in: firmicutes)]